MLKIVNKKLFGIFILVIFTGVLVWGGIHYVPKGKAYFILKDDMAALKRSEAMAWRNVGLHMSVTIEPKIGDKKDSFSVMAHVYNHDILVHSVQVGHLRNSLDDNGVTIQLYQTEGKGFKLEGVGGGMGFSTEYFLADLNEMSGFGLKMNEKVKMAKGNDEKVIATYTIGTAFRNISPEMTLGSYEPINENPMTVVFTVKHEQ